jgi:phage shock protein A
MIALFRRIAKIFEAKTNAAIDRAEDPVAMLEQGLRDLDNHFKTSVEGLIGQKTVGKKLEHQLSNLVSISENYEKKAISILTKVKKNEINKEDGERQALNLLTEKSRYESMAQKIKDQKEKQNSEIEKAEKQIQSLKLLIFNKKNEIQVLKARSKASQSRVSINKQLSKLNTNDTLVMMERMKDKIDENDALADAYEELYVIDDMSGSPISLNSSSDQEEVFKSCATKELEDIQRKLQTSHGIKFLE